MSKKRQPPSIITKFARQLSHILVDELTTVPEKKSMYPLSSRVFIKVLLTLSNSTLYREELLFRDYARAHDEQWEDYWTYSGKQQRVYSAAVYYAEELFCRRIMLVSKLGRLPNNLHMLLLMLIRNSADERWQKTRIRRYLEVELHIHEAFFKPVADILKAQCSKLKDTGAYAKTARKQYGPLYLCAGHNRAEVPDEMNLKEVIEAVVPVPLNPAMQQLPAWYTGLVERIVVSLNEEYGLLRSCGLPTQEFKGALSIGRLRELKALRKQAERYCQAGESKNIEDAYFKAFNNCVGKSAGFECYENFADSEIGMKMMAIPIISLDDENASYDEPVVKDTNPKIDWERFMQDNASEFTPFLAYSFIWLVILQNDIYGHEGLLQDEEFRQLQAQDKVYADLEDKALVDKLFAALFAIIKRHLPPDFYSDVYPD